MGVCHWSCRISSIRKRRSNSQFAPLQGPFSQSAGLSDRRNQAFSWREPLNRPAIRCVTAQSHYTRSVQATRKTPGNKQSGNLASEVNIPDEKVKISNQFSSSKCSYFGKLFLLCLFPEKYLMPRTKSARSIFTGSAEKMRSILRTLTVCSMAKRRPVW